MLIHTTFGRNSKASRGGALTTVVVITATVTLFAGIALTLAASSVNEVEHERKRIQSLYSAEAGINAGLAQLAVAWRTGADVAPAIGSRDEPAGESNNRFWTSITENADSSYTIQASGRAGSQIRTVEVIAVPTPANPFAHSMYAGNLSEDPAYDLVLSGTGGQADQVSGGIFSGGDLTVKGDAVIIGDATASGLVSGITGKEGVESQVPQLLNIDYSIFNDFDVAALFVGSSRVSDNAGGTANQLPVSSPAHIFRLNPSDRTADTGLTAKDDYFLEDPYESVRADYSQDGSDAFELSLLESANNSVFYIDGNLWIHNKKSYSFKLTSAGVDPTRVTFVVSGNIYFSDNFFYDNPNADGAAFVALADEDEPDSGNIYFGDPRFGTMAFAEAMMFAENDFVDVNLDASGSSNIEIRGSMTAGNQVAIERDYIRGDGSVAHTQLRLTHDDRQLLGLLNLPGIPEELDRGNGYEIASWREVPTPKVYAAPTEDIKVAKPLQPSTAIEDEKVDPATVPDNEPNWRKRWAAKKPEWKTKEREGKWKNKKKKKEDKKDEKVKVGMTNTAVESMGGFC